MAIAVDQPDCRRIHEVEVAPYKFGKGWFRPIPDEAREQFLRVSHHRFTIKDPRTWEIRQKSFRSYQLRTILGAGVRGLRSGLGHGLEGPQLRSRRHRAAGEVQAEEFLLL